jgi:23S rRNA (adenine2503-C2)-methyltransferase
MGMGEPLDNPDEVFNALEILTAPYGYAWSPKRITLSTIGIRKIIPKLLTQTTCHVAVSLHSPFPEQRLSIIPMEKTNPLFDVLKQLKSCDFSHQRRLSFEYILFKNFNDSLRHAKELVHILSGISCRVNLIRFHHIPDVKLESADPDAIQLFQAYLEKNNIICTLRKSRGEDISAACGMLKIGERISN